MSMKKSFLYFMAGLYILAGLNHFISMDFYRPMMPAWIPADWHDLLIQLSGVAESGLGIALIPLATRKWAALGVIALLIAVFPANLYMLQTGGQGYNFPIWGLWLRLPIQGILIWWAWLYYRNPELN